MPPSHCAGHVEPHSQHSVLAVCDGQSFVLACPEGQVITSIDGAFYGRADRSTCATPRAAAMQDTNCSLASAGREMAAVCVGQATCSPRGKAQAYSADPCPGTFKYSSAVYSCALTPPTQATNRRRLTV